MRQFCYNILMLRDKDLREPLFDYLEANFGKNRIIEEKVIGKTRADVVMITEDSFFGIEIKSDADTYVRLERQVKDYNRVFDFNLVAVGESHSKHVAEHVPDYWGILVFKEQEKGIIVEQLREPQPNPKKRKDVQFRNQICFLWRAELAHILSMNNLPRYPSLGRQKVAVKLMEKLPWDTLKRQVCEELFERDYTIYNKENEDED